MKKKRSQRRFLSNRVAGAAAQIEDKLEFDPVSMNLLNNENTDALLRSQYRQG